MCGITGFYQTSFNYTLLPHWHTRLQQMHHSLNHRGSAEDDIILHPHAGLAHVRQKALSPQQNQQPVSRKVAEHKNCTIVYNGTLYNPKELRQQLTATNLRWETDEDAELILNGYLTCGVDFFQQLNGTFAFAIYDEAADQLLLCRDHLGIKPLFYQQTEDEFFFGSEQKALFAGGIKPQLNADSWHEVLGLGPARSPGHGVFVNMKELLPGHYLLVKDRQIKQIAYWQLQAKPHTDSYEDTVQTVASLVQDSVQRQMKSKLPICTFLSGGLDSSLVSALCARQLAEQGQQLHTYSFDFVDNSKNFQANSFQASLDRPYVDIMVNHIHSQHTYLECSNQIQADYLYKAVDARDLPCMADVESSLLYFCSQVAPHHPVALTGECADEIFGGYPWFHQPAALQRQHFPWSYQMDVRTALLRDDFLAELHLEEYAQAAYDKTIAATPRLDEESSLDARRREIAYLNFVWFMATLVNRMDRTSMYSSLEARVPFADYRILEYVFNVPWEMKCRNGRTKSLLQDMGRTLLPREVLFRKKSPYPKTYDPAYENLLRNRLLDIMSYANSPVLNIIDPKKVRAFLDTPSDYGRPWFGQLMAGPQMIAYLLQINYWMTKFKL